MESNNHEVPSTGVSWMGVEETEQSGSSRTSRDPHEEHRNRGVWQYTILSHRT